jgi:hypothetical protein
MSQLGQWRTKTPVNGARPQSPGKPTSQPADGGRKTEMFKLLWPKIEQIDKS